MKSNRRAFGAYDEVYCTPNWIFFVHCSLLCERERTASVCVSVRMCFVFRDIVYVWMYFFFFWHFIRICGYFFSHSFLSLLLQCCVTQLVSLPACLLACWCACVSFNLYDGIKTFPCFCWWCIMYMMRACEHAFFGYRFFAVFFHIWFLTVVVTVFFSSLCPQYVYWMNIFLYDMPYMPQFISL